MNEAVQQANTVKPGLSQWQRISCIFTAPSKTFRDINEGNRSWWMPYLIGVLVTYIFFAAITTKVGWTQVAQNAMHLNPKQEERMQQMQPDQRATAMKFTQYAMEGGFAASPVLSLGIVALGTLVLWGTINFVFGGKATFPKVFVVWMYGSLPMLIKSVLGTIVVFAGVAPESFNLNTPAPTSIGAFMAPQDTNPALYAFATWIDFTTIWTLCVMGIGIAIVAGVKRSSGYVTMFGWWGIMVIASTLWALAMS